MDESDSTSSTLPVATDPSPPEPHAETVPEQRTPDAPLVFTRGLTSLWSARRPIRVSPAADLTARVLAARGWTVESDEAQRFLSPSLRHLHDPSGIPDLDRAAQRLLRAARDGEAIVIYGDYDVDGVTATAILYHLLRAVVPNADVRRYVPHRIDEGYGLNRDALLKLASDGAKVIVSVDCGVTAVAPAAAVKPLGVDLIITDHHNPPARMEDLPDAFAVVHPRRPDSTYPFGDLCGAGVAFKLAWRLATLACGSERVPEAIRELLLDLLALASLGVIADVVPLLGENRVIAKFGLSRLRHTRLEGLQALIAASGLAGESVHEEDVGFKLAPRLNACGRMGHAREAVELLTTATGARAVEIAEMLTRQNNERRRLEHRIFEHAAELAAERGMTAPDSRAIVLAHPDWHQGVVGIVCSRLVERFHRPTLLLQDHGEECHGSGRSIDDFNLHAALSACSSRLASFGGHDMAAGLRLRSADMGAFTHEFLAHCAAALAARDLMPRRAFDAHAHLAELSLDAVRRLQLLAPFGRSNPRVTLRVDALRVIGRAQTFGSANKHLSLHVRDARSHDAGPIVRLISWNGARLVHDIPPGATIDALLRPGISTWGGGARVECEIEDLVVRPTADRTAGLSPP